MYGLHTMWVAACWGMAQMMTASGLQPCSLTAAPYLPSIRAECGSLTVPLTPDGPMQTLDLFVARIPAWGPSTDPDPVVILAGGPGQAASELAPALYGQLQPLLRSRDLWVVDQRGTGRSTPLRCEMPGDGVLEAAEAHVEAVGAWVADCLKELPTDPRPFTTSMAVRDLETVRSHFGLKAWNLLAFSYGTRVALHYVRSFPEGVRAAILDGVVSEERVLGPSISVHTEHSLSRLFERCRLDTPCFEHAKDPARNLEHLLSSLKTPRTVSIPHPVRGDWQEVRMDRARLRATVRLMTYRRETRSVLPLMLHLAAGRDRFEPLAAQSVQVVETTTKGLAFGMHNAVVCTEDAPRFPAPQEVEARLKRTFLGSAAFEFLSKMCDDWPQGILDPDLFTPLKTDTPLLLLSGEVDPITPPADAQAMADRLPSARHLVAPGHGHGALTAGCMPRLVEAFLEAPKQPLPSPDCLRRHGPLPFAVDVNGPPP